MAKTVKKAKSKAKATVAKAISEGRKEDEAKRRVILKGKEMDLKDAIEIGLDNAELISKDHYAITKLNARVDRLVAALSTAKPIKKDY